MHFLLPRKSRYKNTYSSKTCYSGWHDKLCMCISQWYRYHSFVNCIFSEFNYLGLDKLCMSFGISRNRHWLPIHDLGANLGPKESKSLLFFHAFSGCDTVSGSRGKGKKSLFNTWKILPEITDTFFKLSQFPAFIEEIDI